MAAGVMVRAEGTPYALGHAHGRARGPALRAFLADGLTRLDALLLEPVTLEQLRPELAGYRDAVQDFAPDLAEEVRGLAEGAGISPDQAWLLQARREVMGYHRIPAVAAGGDCTTYAAVTGLEGSDSVLAQTVDLNGNLDDQLAVLDFTHAENRRRVLLLSFGGQLGYLGLNSDGLAIGLNLVLGGTWGAGVPAYLAIRHLLDRAGSLAEALELIRRIPFASSRTIVLADATGTATVEILDRRLRIVAGRESLHSNHYLDPEFSTQDEINVFARNSSRRRLEVARARLSPVGSVEEHFAALSTAPLRVPDTGDIRRERTVAAVVMHPTRGELHVRRGDPALTETESHSIVAHFGR